MRNIGSDEIVFDEGGMKGVLELDAVDGKSVLVRVKEFEWEEEVICDRCERKFMREVKVPEYTAKYTLDRKEFEDSEEDVLFLIDARNETIDVKELFYQVSHSEDPFVTRCETCEMALENQELEE